VSPRNAIVRQGRAGYNLAMTLWITLALMTGAAVMAVLWPLSRRPGRVSSLDPDAQFYRDQLTEIARDEARGLISAADAEAAKAEAARRLLRTAGAMRSGAESVGEPALRRRRAASALALSTVPLLALAVYGALGSPQLPGRPLASRVDEDPERLGMAAAVGKVEAHLAEHPDDGRGWEVIAPVYLRLGRMQDAVNAYAAAIRLSGESAPRLSAYGESLVAANDGVISADARAAFERAAALDSGSPKPQFYLARAAEQDGDLASARVRYEALAAAAPADAPWVPFVREQLASLEARATGTAIASLAPDDREKAIRGMVEGLARRLDSGRGTPEEWQRLVRAYAVVGDRDKAAAALTKARAALAPDQTAVATIDGLARDLGLGPAGRDP
jgi:cytochrome c-type biogenesis protein CcmH